MPSKPDKQKSIPALPPGRIDIHCHLIPGIDDGCVDMAESLACVRKLKAAGFVGSVCTPHVYFQEYPDITPSHIEGWTAQLQNAIDGAGLEYRVWPGGEVRLYIGLVDWFKSHGVPTLAGSRCVLVDLWEEKWEKWATPIFEWLLRNKYQPVLAHPERLPARSGHDKLDQQISKLEKMGVWLQGNFASFTGEEGVVADRLARQWTREGRYKFLALDLHRPQRMNSRLDGLGIAETEFGAQAVARLIEEAPRRHILKA